MAGVRERGHFKYREFEGSPEISHCPNVSSVRSEDPSRLRRLGRVAGWNPWCGVSEMRSHSPPANECTFHLSTLNRNQMQRNSFILQPECMLQIQNPDRLLSENIPSAIADDEFIRSHIDMPPKLPNWIWASLVAILGIKTSSTKQVCIATALHIITLIAAFSFGASGFVFNIYDSLGKFSKTTVLVGIAKSVLGLYWIGIGIYANSLAARLFSNKRMVDCIRLHSKTFLKISTVLIIVILSMIVIATNLYTNIYLLDNKASGNETGVVDSNCATIGSQVILCQIYFGSKVFYSILCLTWNLLVACIYLSVCRTHTISIRRFMKELMYDTKIFEEFCMIQALEEQQQQPANQRNHSAVADNLNEFDIWHDDIANFDTDSHSEPPSNAHLLRTLRVMRQNTRSQLTQLTNETGSQQPESLYMSCSIPNRERSNSSRGWHLGEDNNSVASDLDSVGSPEQGEKTILGTPIQESTQYKNLPSHDRAMDGKVPQASTPQEPSHVPAQVTRSFLSDVQPPIMKNEDLMFTYFQLLRRLSSTSRLLQRWISSWITFIMLWCSLLIVYWTTHTAQLSGIVQFLTPLVALGLLTSAYAEVNFEGERLLKCVLPTEERMSVLYYFQSTKLELKIFSFTMTYNTIVTVVAGIAVTFATRIILDQFVK
ncbi:uncharacterized protein LOC131931924 isoform X2 [Physella acuta]|uniref:uncharacterized protein LOC131931924 isoform X2 n=1 Tax=Physella acuta TaxID=109671 RepID=UPI0027DB1DBF|nr:uncharacterized protein LOC131931924 isoform X2 [Physella acuta]